MQENTKLTRPILEALGLSFGPGNYKNEICLQMLTLYVSEKQFDCLAKCSRFGWKFSKIVWSNIEGKCAVALTSKDCAAWMLPDGSLERAPVGKSRAYLPKGWSEV